MSPAVGHSPIARYAHASAGGKPVQLFVSPSQYVQGPGVLDSSGALLEGHVAAGVGVVITPGRNKVLGERLRTALRSAGMPVVLEEFRGESTLEEAERLAKALKGAKHPVDLVMAVGGGKCLDAGRMAANRLGASAVMVPTTASTDAPTAAHSVIYDQNGVFVGIEFSLTNPLLVLVDLDVIADAPARYLVAGMGDAFSTFFEARCCLENRASQTCRGGRPTVAAYAIARQCKEVLLEHGVAALSELREKKPGLALSRITEANILLSGLGFESGGLAAAHAVAQGLTACTDLHRNCLHGELVAIGVMSMLMLEDRMAEAKEAAGFMRSVGLPLHLGQIGFDPVQRAADLDRIVDCAMGVAFLSAEPFAVTHGKLREAIMKAHEFGK
ncbi:MAG: glycerol dehydrogenase [Candidatus Riflebacteria bacterium]|nr:glycerol dehydrogenase [Candidatus Riflebacteria bacterium]